MTEKRFTTKNIICSNYCVWDNNDKSYGNDEVAKLLNELYEENQSIKKHIGELYKFVKIDVDNEIEVYPKILLEYIVNILKIIGDVE